jgi:anti-sigma B factor antagonist
MSVPLRLAEHTAGDVVVLELHGHLVVEEGDRALRERVRALAAAGRRSILVDLGDVSYVDSGGVGTLVQLYTELASQGGRLTLLHPSPHSGHVLRITRLTSVFEIFDDEAAALRRMAQAVSAPTIVQ